MVIKMGNREFYTVGRELFPGYELRITCDLDTDFLEREKSESLFQIVYIKDGYTIFRNGENSHLVTSPTVLCLNDTDDVELHSGVSLKMDIIYFAPYCFEINGFYTSIEEWKKSLNTDSWFFRPFFERRKSYIGACPTNHYLGNRASQLIDRADKELHTQKDLSWPCRSRSYLIELLLLVNSIYDENSDQENIYYGKMTDEIRELINWLHIHYLEKISIEMITKQFHTNKTTINQKFKTVMGMTIMEYIGSLRMQIACSFLRKTLLPINEIIERTGYKNDTHFLRTFKKHTGCTPTEYRNQNKVPT